MLLFIYFLLSSLSPFEEYWVTKSLSYNPPLFPSLIWFLLLYLQKSSPIRLFFHMRCNCETYTHLSQETCGSGKRENTSQ